MWIDLFSLKKVLFLYTELAEYFVVCAKELAKSAEVHIVRWPVNKDAPFQFNVPDSIKIYNRNEYDHISIKQLINLISPDVIVCSGWLDKGYLKAVSGYKNKIPVILTLDNQWTGSIKQMLATNIGKYFLLRKFTHVWVPGPRQEKYASKLGFKQENILTGFYSADHNLFNTLYEKHKEAKQKKFPKKFLFVGRYIKHKGIEDLWQAFIALQTENPNEWELWCVGTGELEHIAPKHPKIKHLGFIQPTDIETIVKETGVFILPSHFEPWGVVVHEYATAGFPLICSDQVGATSILLKDKENGFLFPAKNISALKKSLQKIIQLPNSELIKMGNASATLAKSITPEKWVHTIQSII